MFVGLLIYYSLFVQYRSIFSFGLERSPDEFDTDIALHDLSPRHKRQAYPVYSASEGKLILDPVGQREAGPWDQWDTDAQCSRTCGGGVRIETRKCAGTGCIGSRKRYVSCNIEPCPDAAKDYRTEQCAAFNDKPLEGRYYKWKAYTKAPNKCELTCMPEGESFYYKWADSVVDGTKCDEFSNDICVEGYCLPLGCDGKLGSLMKADKCGLCGGDGTTCKTMRGFFDERHISPGYVDIITFPVGATSILIEESKPTNNYLALRNESGAYFLNGNWKIDFPQTMEIAGTLFEYDRNRYGLVGQEKIAAKGPLTEPIVLALLYQAEHTGIAYEYTLPLDETLPSYYKVGPWEECSATCGKGYQSRSLTCVDRITKEPVSDDLCVNSSRPEANQTCNTIDCDAHFFTGEWEQCSSTCGPNGIQYRVIYCHRVAADGIRTTVDDNECANVTGGRPDVKQPCNRFACPEWQAGPWSSCSKDCGNAFQYRAVTCRSEKSGEEGKLLAHKYCNETLKPDGQRTCNLGPCEGLRWVSSDWTICSKCNETTEYRNVTCEDANGRRYPGEKCKDKRPDDIRDCVTVIPCAYKWQSSQWSECSSKCGHGHQTRSVYCTIDEDGFLKKMSESFCDASLRPSTSQNCTHEGESCSGTYYSSPWSNCTAECDGGIQTRTAVCFDYDFKVRPQMCDENEMPELEQDCNLEPCVGCNATEFGCCPDGETIAAGPYLEGCSNCSETEFGCCSDNYTIAEGENYAGCPIQPTTTDGVEISGDEIPSPECTFSEYGCCPDGITASQTLDQSDCPETLCNYTNAAGISVQIACVNVSLYNETETIGLMLNETELLFGNETESNITVEIHCSKTEFGCCPDWYTPANGTDFMGCPVFEIGNCNETKYGCCPDELTLSRGPNLEGCGDASCAASLFGCCKDRMTIAFGTHYSGCERANQPCETSKFGCCSDGLTAALGTNGEGCEEDCRLTKYGCCPDGKTVSTGVNNEGCGCSSSRYGCCPDGKSPADGPSFKGCPETCARSYYGCCPDGKTAAQGPQKEGCPCQYTTFGCCPDGETPARGPNNELCDDCRYWKFGCCADGQTKALGPNRMGCDISPSAVTPYRPPGVTTSASPDKIAACTLPKSDGEVCADYVLMWFYDAAEGVCRQFWFGGCGGNENRFGSEEECKSVCIEPVGIGVCYLPKIEGPADCGQVEARWFYDLRVQQCQPFYYRGCNGNANNFGSYDQCMQRCQAVRAGSDAPTAGFRPTEPFHPATASPVYLETIPPPDACLQPKTEGTEECGNEEARWYFDQNVGQCQPFYYKGCRGNANNFNSYDVCMQHCRSSGGVYDQPTTPLQRQPIVMPPSGDICDWPVDAGSCQNYVESWYFDVGSRQCNVFQYGGCGGNPNRFQSRVECEQLCRHKLGHVAPAPALVDQTCKLPVEQGNCGDRTDRWHFDPLAGRCVPFIYTGCGGNANNFGSENECKHKCGQYDATSAEDPCFLAKDSGPCDTFAPKWFFNAADGTCGRFYYGGCHGNKNRFEKLEECEEKCANRLDPCTLPGVQGPCGGSLARWYFDSKSRDCKPFTYGGCLGNANRFETIEACQARCASGDAPLPPAPVDRSQQLNIRPTVAAPASRLKNKTTNACYLSVDPGRCHGYHYRYYFNSATRRCEAFIYTGCDGNDNRFERVEECESLCGAYSRRHLQADILSANGDNHDLFLFKSIPATFPSLEATSTSTSHFFVTQPSLIPLGASDVADADLNAAEDICSLAPDTGTCNVMTTRWYYDPRHKACKEFSYGGCLGNLNNFETLSLCREYCVEDSSENQDQSNRIHEITPVLTPVIGGNSVTDDGPMPPHSYPPPSSPLPDLCKQPRDPGDCYESLLRYYYDSDSRKCASFQFTNCKGNTNRFASIEECDRACGQYRDTGLCALPPDAGDCLASVMKWFWNPSKGHCESFVYGGCGGNGNRFGSREECESLCRKETESLPVDICDQKAEPGPCDSNLQRYYFDNDSKICKSFMYGGCRGNGNNFENVLACELRCARAKSEFADVCHLAYDSGPCTEAITQYFYDPSATECKPFTFGGCRGNGNRFDSKEQCERVCKNAKTSALSSRNDTICRMPFDQGPCGARALRYYYNTSSNKCESFVYGGCLGNENRFFTEQECYDECQHLSPAEQSIGTLEHTTPTTEPSLPHCFDDPSKANCMLVKTAGLCDHSFYGKFCCKTCREFRALKKARRQKLRMQ